MLLNIFTNGVANASLSQLSYIPLVRAKSQAVIYNRMLYIQETWALGKGKITLSWGWLR